MPFSKVATKEDILSCFRLLLGRDPNPEERAGHFARVGEPLHSVVASYLSSAEFDRQALITVKDDERPTFGEFNGLQIAAYEDDLLIGKHVLAGVYEPEVQGIVKAHLKPGMTFLDVGANIGTFSLVASKIVGPTGTVVAIEPNVNNVKLLEISRLLNGFNNMEIHAVAADEKARLLTYNNSYSNGNTSEPDIDIGILLRSTMVPAFSIDSILNGRKVDFIKIDIEGFEYNALRGASIALKDRPMIVSEFSATAVQGGAEEYLSYLFGFGYNISVIEPDGSLSAPQTAPGNIMDAFRDRNEDHIDFFAVPV